MHPRPTASTMEEASLGLWYKDMLLFLLLTALLHQLFPLRELDQPKKPTLLRQIERETGRHEE